MSTNAQGEGQGNTSEGNENQVNLDELNSKLNSLAEQLEAERKSKERVLNESKEWKEKAQAAKAKEDEEARRIEAEREERLKKEGNFQVLLEQRENRIKELEENLNDYQTKLSDKEESIVNLRKASAFERELGGKLKKSSYWNHVDFTKIATNPETGAIDKDSLAKVAGEFVKEYKELIDFGSNGNFPNGTPNGSASGKLTYEQWKALPLKERKKRMGDVVD